MILRNSTVPATFSLWGFLYNYVSSCTMNKGYMVKYSTHQNSL